MPRKRTGYDAACYYDGKLLGRCTKADSDAYTLLMNACGGDAARVLREYAYFSSELRAILEKAALMQADRSRTGGMFHLPFFFLAMYERDGLPLEKVLKNIIRTRFLYPRVRPYKTENFYALLSARKEAQPIAKQQKGRKARRQKA